MTDRVRLLLFGRTTPVHLGAEPGELFQLQRRRGMLALIHFQKRRKGFPNGDDLLRLRVDFIRGQARDAPDLFQEAWVQFDTKFNVRKVPRLHPRLLKNLAEQCR